MGIDERSVRRHLKALQEAGLLKITRRGLGKTNIYEVDVSARVTAHQTRRSRPDKNVRPDRRNGQNRPLVSAAVILTQVAD